MIKTSIICSRHDSPNIYLFKNFVSAVSQNSYFTLANSGIIGKVRPQNVDCLIVFGGENADESVLDLYLERSKLKVIWFTEDPYEIKSNLAVSRKYDLVLTTHFESQYEYSQAFFLPLASNIYKTPLRKPINYDAFFFGSLWPNRANFLKSISSNDRFRSFKFLVFLFQTTSSFVNKIHLEQIYENFKGTPSCLRTIYRPISIEKANEFANQSKFILNMPRLFENDLTSVPGPRIFESSYALRPQILDSNAQPNLSRLFPKEAFIDFGFEDQGVESFFDLLEKHKDLDITAQNALQHTKLNHNWHVRVLQLIQILKDFV